MTCDCHCCVPSHDFPIYRPLVPWYMPWFNELNPPAIRKSNEQMLDLTTLEGRVEFVFNLKTLVLFELQSHGIHATELWPTPNKAYMRSGKALRLPPLDTPSQRTEFFLTYSEILKRWQRLFREETEKFFKKLYNADGALPPHVLPKKGSLAFSDK